MPQHDSMIAWVPFLHRLLTVFSSKARAPIPPQLKGSFLPLARLVLKEEFRGIQRKVGKLDSGPSASGSFDRCFLMLLRADDGKACNYRLHQGYIQDQTSMGGFK